MNIKSNPFGSCFQHEIVQMQFDISIFDIHVVRKKINKQFCAFDKMVYRLSMYHSLVENLKPNRIKSIDRILTRIC